MSKPPTALDIECALSRYFNARTNIIVPNVSWGLGLHECDLLVLTPSNYAYEVEIKRSRADILADKKKHHDHYNEKISKLFFAIPENLWECVDLIPGHAGIISITEKGVGNYCCRLDRKAQRKSDYRFSADEKTQLARLGTMRVWTLKHRIQALLDRLEKDNEINRI